MLYFRLCFALVLLCVATAAANPLGAQPTLVLTVHFESEPPPLSEVQATLRETDRLLRWNSSDMTWLEPVYVPPFHPSQEPEAYRTPDGLRQLRREALDAVHHLAQLRQYRRLVLLLPAEFPGQGSLATVGYELIHCEQDDFYATTAWVRWEGSTAHVLLHELGHNFGFVHDQGCMDPHHQGTGYSTQARTQVGWPAEPLGATR